MATWRKPHTIKPDFSKQNLPDFPATKFIDQLSFVGNELVSCFILETAKGYVLLDCMNPDLVQGEVRRQAVHVQDRLGICPEYA